jgi:hypothetical protein
MAFIEASDFKGKYKLSQDQVNQTITTNVVAEMRDPLIRKIYGATMGNEIITYIDTAPAPPANPLLDAVINPFSEDLEHSCGCNEPTMIESIGLKNVLLGFIYYQRACDMKLQMQSVGGETRPKTENSISDMLPVAKMIQRYNDSVNSVRAIQAHILNNRSDYPNYNGQKFLLNYIL